jgi:hypothetical protein
MSENDAVNMYFIDDELNKVLNDIYLKYINDGEVNGLIKTYYNVTPTNHDFLLLKRKLMEHLSNLDKNYYIDDIKFEFGIYSRDVIFNKKHQWDGVGIIMTFGLITPFILPSIVRDLYDYYNNIDYNFINYNIIKRKSNVIV